ncbi:MAG: hypothetical protein A4E48_02358 [Methanosaeta sp. PtaU1.Bin060]|jgi:hypothetical protein|nr:MAG: hypothetical protein A4E44_02180 [Methanosaeta sp. PtaB.Bin018]OPY49225.1 MAG: hypothetical protein A4E48_02358 [Methanosaeta sp. PtaU1.Bin060]
MKGKNRTRIARRDIMRSLAKNAVRKARQRAAYDRRQYDGHGETPSVEA